MAQLWCASASRWRMRASSSLSSGTKFVESFGLVQFNGKEGSYGCPLRSGQDRVTLKRAATQPRVNGTADFSG